MRVGSGGRWSQTGKKGLYCIGSPEPHEGICTLFIGQWEVIKVLSRKMVQLDLPFRNMTLASILDNRLVKRRW